MSRATTIISFDTGCISQAMQSITGPTAMATVVPMASRSRERFSKWIGERGLLALERLAGLLLTAIAVVMLLRAIEAFLWQLQAG